MGAHFLRPVPPREGSSAPSRFFTLVCGPPDGELLQRNLLVGDNAYHQQTTYWPVDDLPRIGEWVGPFPLPEDLEGFLERYQEVVNPSDRSSSAHVSRVQSYRESPPRRDVTFGVERKT